MPNSLKSKGPDKKPIEQITGLVFKTGKGNSEKQVSLSFWQKLKNEDESSKRKSEKSERISSSKRGMQDVFLYAQKPFHLVWQEPTHIPLTYE